MEWLETVLLIMFAVIALGSMFAVVFEDGTGPTVRAWRNLTGPLVTWVRAPSRWCPCGRCRERRRPRAPDAWSIAWGREVIAIARTSAPAGGIVEVEMTP